MPPRIGVVAGAGEMPERVIAACRAGLRDPFVIGLRDQADPASFSRPPDAWIRVGEGGEGIRLLKSAGAEEVVLVGGVSRPSLRALRPDAWTARFLTRIGPAWYRDGSILDAIASALEREGLRVVAPDTLASSLAASARVYGRRVPGEEDRSDIARGFEVARALGALDVGQGAVVQRGRVIGVEAAEGTDALIERCGRLLSSGEGGVLVKACRPGQDLRIDLPAIGPRTVANAARIGLAGIAVEAGRALILDAEAVTRDADAAGLFVIGVDRPG